MQVTGMTRKQWQEQTRSGQINFTCEHCGKDVPWARFEGQDKPRNHCPWCLWSKHVSIGEDDFPPCNGMMRGTDVGNEQVVWRCLGCGFMMRGPTDDYMFRVLANGDGFKSSGVSGVIYER
jgi:hypothetical protein